MFKRKTLSRALSLAFAGGFAITALAQQEPKPQ